MLRIRTFFYNFLLYSLIVIMGLIYLIPSIFSRNAAYHGINLFCKINRFLLKAICGLRQEIRGPIPTEACIVCAKHMSFLDIIMLADALPAVKFVMKDSLKYVPIFGFYAMRIGSAPVKRGTGSKAVEKMVSDLSDEALTGQTVIFPQGTRVLPGQELPYKRGAAYLYKDFNLPVHLAATNVGVLWGRRSPYIYPGLAIVEFLDKRIEPGMNSRKFMEEIEADIETASNRLMEDYPRYYKG